MRNKKISRKELLNFALTIIKDEGLEACTIRNIANSSGIAVGTVYNYFSSHDELLREIFISSWTKTIDYLNDAVERVEQPYEKLSAFVSLMLEEIRNRKGLGEVVITSQNASIMPESTHRELFGRLSLIIKDIIKEGERNAGLSESELLMISHWVLGAIFSHISARQCTDDKLINHLIAYFL